MRFALCQLRRNPGFSLVNAVLLRPIAYQDPDRPGWIWEMKAIDRECCVVRPAKPSIANLKSKI